MKLSPAASEAVREALSEVVRRAQIAQQCPDTEATVKALRDVSWAVIRASDITRTVERETREAALRNLERRSAA